MIETDLTTKDQQINATIDLFSSLCSQFIQQCAQIKVRADLTKEEIEVIFFSTLKTLVLNIHKTGNEVIQKDHNLSMLDSMVQQRIESNLIFMANTPENAAALSAYIKSINKGSEN